MRRSGGPSRWLPLRKPAKHHSTPRDHRPHSIIFILPNPPDATRPNCPTTQATTANHRAHGQWPAVHNDKNVCATVVALHAHHAGPSRRCNERTYPLAPPARHRAPLTPAPPGSCARRVAAHWLRAINGPPHARRPRQNGRPRAARARPGHPRARRPRRRLDEQASVWRRSADLPPAGTESRPEKTSQLSRRLASLSPRAELVRAPCAPHVPPAL